MGMIEMSYLIPKPNSAKVVVQIVEAMLIEGKEPTEKLKLIINTLLMNGWITDQGMDELNNRLNPNESVLICYKCKGAIDGDNPYGYVDSNGWRHTVCLDKSGDK